ncbi:hypothetical protein [Methylorubrum sp. SB2]
MIPRPSAAVEPRLNLTALAIAIAGPGSIIAAVIGSGWLWSLQP